ncbi:hypothetical protein R3P38DRAFT_2758132 [Favolaschia claudopus]|uniref:Uncharacterized protein n=1 Tax=Favolaschia claudopus TaxID=2862362 RepID=A0AAW0EDK2_9AGAR
MKFTVIFSTLFAVITVVSGLTVPDSEVSSPAGADARRQLRLKGPPPTADESDSQYFNPLAAPYSKITTSSSARYTWIGLYHDGSRRWRMEGELHINNLSIDFERVSLFRYFRIVKFWKSSSRGLSGVT